MQRLTKQLDSQMAIKRQHELRTKASRAVDLLQLPQPALLRRQTKTFNND